MENTSASRGKKEPNIHNHTIEVLLPSFFLMMYIQIHTHVLKIKLGSQLNILFFPLSIFHKHLPTIKYKHRNFIGYLYSCVDCTVTHLNVLLLLGVEGVSEFSLLQKLTVNILVHKSSLHLSLAHICRFLEVELREQRVQHFKTLSVTLPN